MKSKTGIQDCERALLCAIDNLKAALALPDPLAKASLLTLVMEEINKAQMGVTKEIHATLAGARAKDD